MDTKEALRIRDQFRGSEQLQKELTHWLGYFARLCAANAMVSGFHEDEAHLRACCEHGLFEEGSSYETGPVSDAWVEDNLSWFDSAVLQAELARQMSEIGEAVEALRNQKRDEHCPEFSNFLIEEADVMIRIGDTLGKRGMPIGEAVVAKLLYNMSRPRKHGKRS